MRRLCLLLGLLAVLALTAQAAPQPASTQPADNEFASFGVILNVGPGWYRLAQNRPGMIARWGDHPAGSRDTVAMMAIEMEPSQGRSAEQYAAAAAVKEHAGKSAAATVMLGGEKAQWVWGETIDDMVAASLVAAHGKHIYCINGFADAQRDLPTAAMEKLAKELIFAEPAAPSKDMHLSDEEYSFPHFTFKTPATMRPAPVPAGSEQMVIGATSFVTDQVEFVIAVEALPNPGNGSIEQIAQQALQVLRPRHPVSWGFIRTAPQRAITTLFSDETGDMPAEQRLGLVQISPSEFACIHFTIRGDASARAVYEKASEQVVRSVQLRAK